MTITGSWRLFIEKWEQHQSSSWKSLKIKKHERYLELRLFLMTNRKKYKKWGKLSATHILNQHVNWLGEDADEVFKLIQEKCLRVD